MFHILILDFHIMSIANHFVLEQEDEIEFEDVTEAEEEAEEITMNGTEDEFPG